MNYIADIDIYEIDINWESSGINEVLKRHMRAATAAIGKKKMHVLPER